MIYCVLLLILIITDVVGSLIMFAILNLVRRSASLNTQYPLTIYAQICPVIVKTYLFYLYYPFCSLHHRALYSLPSLSARPNLQLTDFHTPTRTLVDPPNAGNVLELQMECRYTWKLSREQMMFQGIQEHLYIIRETLAKLNAVRQI